MLHKRIRKQGTKIVAYIVELSKNVFEIFFWYELSPFGKKVFTTAKTIQSPIILLLLLQNALPMKAIDISSS